MDLEAIYADIDNEERLKHALIRVEEIAPGRVTIGSMVDAEELEALAAILRKHFPESE